MGSSGALLDPVALLAKDTILSGPAGGMVGAVAAAQRAGVAGGALVGFDMGGTSTDVFCVPAGVGLADVERSPQTEIAGLTLLAPRLPIHTVAAGGGSILSAEEQRLQVGPRSAGADPGPACYRRGGPLCLTDSHLLLGRLQVDQFPAVFGPQGDQPPDLAVVQQRFAELAAPLGGSVEALAQGALDLAVETMAAAIEQVSLFCGHDIRGGVLIAYGGAGGQLACRLAEFLGLGRVLLHPLAGVLSAWGIGQAQERRWQQRAVREPLSHELLEQLKHWIEQQQSGSGPRGVWNCVIKPMSRACCCRGRWALAPRSWSTPLRRPISSALAIALPLEPGWWWSESRPSGRCRQQVRAQPQCPWLQLHRRGHGPPRRCTSPEWVGSPCRWWRAPACNRARDWWGLR